jgi:hypothetical protein
MDMEASLCIPPLSGDHPRGAALFEGPRIRSWECEVMRDAHPESSLRWKSSQFTSKELSYGRNRPKWSHTITVILKGVETSTGNNAYKPFVLGTSFRRNGLS